MYYIATTIYGLYRWCLLMARTAAARHFLLVDNRDSIGTAWLNAEIVLVARTIFVQAGHNAKPSELALQTNTDRYQPLNTQITYPGFLLNRRKDMRWHFPDHVWKNSETVSSATSAFPVSSYSSPLTPFHHYFGLMTIPQVTTWFFFILIHHGHAQQPTAP